eukprot:CAMPEP_0176440314 /NCGR_PEP_ID=MMETSP0127-20121128/20491_1 /TAXON_ID=938130 /ORGANISM="Platyophrya macrostoma, Strain WH" /LENGTH=218 /DNA_ID=CAMNT_0017824803 /DNA_START=249 /DNA_END=904 /DNA_ORIENTATION=-
MSRLKKTLVKENPFGNARPVDPEEARKKREAKEAEEKIRQERERRLQEEEEERQRQERIRREKELEEKRRYEKEKDEENYQKLKISKNGSGKYSKGEEYYDEYDDYGEEDERGGNDYYDSKRRGGRGGRGGRGSDNYRGGNRRGGGRDRGQKPTVTYTVKTEESTSNANPSNDLNKNSALSKEQPKATVANDKDKKDQKKPKDASAGRKSNPFSYLSP